MGVDALIKRGYSAGELSWVIKPRTLSHRRQKHERLSSEETGRWLHKTRKLFDGLNAIEMIQTEAGARLVEDALNQIDAGYFARSYGESAIILICVVSVVSKHQGDGITELFLLCIYLNLLHWRCLKYSFILNSTLVMCQIPFSYWKLITAKERAFLDFLKMPSLIIGEKMKN